MYYYKAVEFNQSHPLYINKPVFQDIMSSKRLYERIISHDKDESIWYTLGLIYFSLGEFHSSIRAHDNSKKIFPNFSAPLFRIGEVHEVLEKFVPICSF